MQDATGHTNEFDIYPKQALGGFEARQRDGGLPFKMMSPDVCENRSSGKQGWEVS